EFPGRFLLGLGISHAPIVDRDEPGRYRRPLSAMRAYLDRLDVATSLRSRLIAALGPRMLELARDRTLGSHPYLVPHAHTAAPRPSRSRRVPASTSPPAPTTSASAWSRATPVIPCRGRPGAGSPPRSSSRQSYMIAAAWLGNADDDHRRSRSPRGGRNTVRAR